MEKQAVFKNARLALLWQWLPRANKYRHMHALKIDAKSSAHTRTAIFNDANMRFLDNRRLLVIDRSTLWIEILVDNYSLPYVGIAVLIALHL